MTLGRKIAMLLLVLLCASVAVQAKWDGINRLEFVSDQYINSRLGSVLNVCFADTFKSGPRTRILNASTIMGLTPFDYQQATNEDDKFQLMITAITDKSLGMPSLVIYDKYGRVVIDSHETIVQLQSFHGPDHVQWVFQIPSKNLPNNSTETYYAHVYLPVEVIRGKTRVELFLSWPLPNAF